MKIASNAKEALVCSAIEQTLLESGGASLLDKINALLYEKYNASMFDCYEHPEYLSEILKKLFGSTYLEILKSIQKQLEEFAYYEPIASFMEKIVAD